MPDTVVTETDDKFRDTLANLKSTENENDNIVVEGDDASIVNESNSNNLSASATPKNDLNNLSNFVESQSAVHSKKGSQKSTMSKNSNNKNAGGGGGVNPLILKGLQDKVEGITAKIEDIYTKANEN